MKKQHVKAHVEVKNGKLLAIASEEVEDRDGEVLSMDGWKLTNFKKNPVILWYHNMRERSLPIGKAKSISKRTINGKKKLVFEPVFEDITEFGRTVKKFFEQEILTSFSVGFMPLEIDGNKFVEQELLEISAVPVPALPSAQVIQRAQKEGLNEVCVKAALGDEEATKKMLNDGDKEVEGGEVEKKVKTTIPYKAHKAAPEGQEWDTGAALKRIRDWAKAEGELDMDKFKLAFTWYNEEKKEDAGEYKLPHHDVVGEEFVTVWRGVAASMAALLGGRSDLEIPEGDRKDVYDHLRKHYRQFEKEAPDFRLVEGQVLKGLDNEISALIVDVNSQKLFSMFKNIRKEIRKKKEPTVEVKKPAIDKNKETVKAVLLIVNKALDNALKKQEGGEK